MPTYNAIQTDRLENYAKRILSIRNGGIMPTVAPELGIEMSIPQLEDMDGLAGYLGWGWYQAQAAVAAEYSYGGVANNTSSSLLVVQLTASCSANTRVTWVVFDTTGVAFDALSPADQANWRDLRRAHAAFPLGAVGIGLGTGTVNVAPPGLGGGGLAIGGCHLLANTMAASPVVVLKPGTAFYAALTIVNQDMTVGATGWLRQATVEELTV